MRSPSKILCVHLNYESRVREFGARLPAAPTYFMKPPSALVGDGEAVVRPPGCRYLNYEGEIVAVIGPDAEAPAAVPDAPDELRGVRHLQPEDAGRFIAGYTVGNDFGLHDFRDTDAGSMLRVKGADTLCPVLPRVVRDWDFRGRALRTLVDGEVRQSGNTDEMRWDPHYLVADLSRTHTLFPGDLVFTGTPAGSRPVEPGAEVVVEVEGLGRLRNPVVERGPGLPAAFGAQPTESEEVRSTALGGDWEFRGRRPPRPERS